MFEGKMRSWSLWFKIKAAEKNGWRQLPHSWGGVTNGSFERIDRALDTTAPKV